VCVVCVSMCNLETPTKRQPRSNFSCSEPQNRKESERFNKNASEAVQVFFQDVFSSLSKCHTKLHA
jgi:uncharacterized protein YbcC (UPF0753/DUF2309 family)